MRPITNVLIKPAGPDRNLDCGYCFYIEKMQSYPGRVPRMSETVLDSLIRQLLAQSVLQISIGWQGSEPTLMGLSFYRKAVEYMQRYGRGQAVSNGFQTNGVLIDRTWAKFFRNYNFLVGLSLDGPEHIHDHYRRNKAGRGSWRKALDTAKRMLDSGVEVNVLSVVNSYSVQFPDEIYTSHKANELNFMQFIPVWRAKARVWQISRWTRPAMEHSCAASSTCGWRISSTAHRLPPSVGSKPCFFSTPASRRPSAYCSKPAAITCLSNIPGMSIPATFSWSRSGNWATCSRLRSQRFSMLPSKLPLVSLNLRCLWIATPASGAPNAAAAAPKTDCATPLLKAAITCVARTKSSSIMQMPVCVSW